MPQPLPASETVDLESCSRSDELAHWRSVFSPSSKEQEDRRHLQRRLDDWSRRHGGLAAAFFRRHDGKTWRRWLQTGEEVWPSELAGVEDEGRAHRFWKLPDCLVLGDARLPERPDREILLIAAGLRISSLKRQLEEHTFQAKFRGVELEALYDVGLAIASTLDLEELYEGMLLHSVSLLDARRGALYLVAGDRFELARTIGGQAIESCAVADVDVEALEKDSSGLEGWLPGSKHLLVVPVEVDGNLKGLLIVADKESRTGVGPFPLHDRRTLSLFANQAAIALENAKLHRLALEKERLEREMELAAEIQQQILPKAIPQFEGFEVLGWNRPARQVGGDYFHLRGPLHGRPSIVVGDVTGKGLPAALLVSTLHSALRLLLDRMEVGPELIERLNRHVHESSSLNKFITLLLAAVDEDGRRLHYVNAGHNPGVVVRGDGEVTELCSGGLPLGLLPDATYEAATVEIGEDDLVCLYSDGITECEAPDEEQYGLERLVALLREHRSEPLSAVIAAIDRAVTEFARGLPQGDDQTVVLLRRR